MKIAGYMAEHIKDTYLIMCANLANLHIEDYLYLKYDQHENVPASLLAKSIPSNKLSERLIRAEKVDKMILEMYNIYNVVQDDVASDVDWTAFELAKIFGR